MEIAKSPVQIETFQNMFDIANFTIKLRALNEIRLPYYSGSTMRGAFGSTLKRITCATKDRDCTNCILKEKCIYSYIFESPILESIQKKTGFPTAPHPIVIEPPPIGKRLIEKNKEFEVGLVLIGKAIEYVPYFIYTFEEMSQKGIGPKRGKFQILKTYSYSGLRKRIIYSGNTKILKKMYKNMDWDYFVKKAKKLQQSRELKIEFLVPVRIKHMRKLDTKLEFETIIKNLLRRIWMLSTIYGDEKLPFEYEEIIKKSRKVKAQDAKLSWFDWERYSRRQDERMNLGGLIGYKIFKGDFKDFLPLLLLGEYIHIGKNTSFGLGKYRIYVK